MPRAVVVGGGLAGMTATLRLLERGCEVTLFDSADRLGGKAGARSGPSGFDEHGYHVFLPWYVNLWKVVRDLGLEENFIDASDLVILKRGEFPSRSYTYHDLPNWRGGPRNLWTGFLPPTDSFLFYYAVFDLLSQPYSRRAFLDGVSAAGFLRSKHFWTPSTEVLFRELLLKGLSIPLTELSAMTLSQALSYWVADPVPTMRILRGNLQEYFIEPWASRIRSLGGDVRLGHELVGIEIDGSRAVGLTFQKSSDDDDRYRVDCADCSVILAIPFERVLPLIDKDLSAASPPLARLHYLRSAPMAAMNIYLRRRLDLPASHVLLADSRYALSFIDVSQTWAGYQNSVLNCVASDITELVGLDSDTMVERLLGSVYEYLPDLSHDDIASVELQPHLDEPLFMNSAGAWAFRPTESDHRALRSSTKSSLLNLHLAGDYCRSFADLVSMEGAVSTGLLAAEAVRAKLGVGQPIETSSPRRSPTWVWRVVKTVAWPLATFISWYVRHRPTHLWGPRQESGR